MLGEWHRAGIKIKNSIGENPTLPFYYIKSDGKVIGTALLSIIRNPKYKLPKGLEGLNFSLSDLEKITLEKDNKLKQIHVLFYMPTFRNLVHEELIYKREYVLPLSVTLSYLVNDTLILLIPLDGPPYLFKLIHLITKNSLETIGGINEIYPKGYEYQALFELLLEIYDKYEIRINILEKEIENRRKRLKKLERKSEDDKLKRLEEIRDSIKKISEFLNELEKERMEMEFWKFALIRVKSGTKKIFKDFSIITLHTNFFNFLKEFIKEYKENVLLKGVRFSNAIIWSIWENVKKQKDFFDEHNLILRDNFFKNILYGTSPHYKSLITGIYSNFSNILSGKYALSPYESKIGIEFIYLLMKSYIKIMIPTDLEKFKKLVEVGENLGKEAKRDNNKGLFYELKLAKNKEEFIKRLSSALYKYNIHLQNEEFLISSTIEELQAYILLGFVKGWNSN